MPARVVELFDSFRSGLNARANPWSWWRTEAAGPFDPRASRSHLYRVTWDGPHEPPARCGYVPPDGAEWERQPPDPPATCPDCSGERELKQAYGSIGGIDVTNRAPAEDA